MSIKHVVEGRSRYQNEGAAGPDKKSRALNKTRSPLWIQVEPTGRVYRGLPDIVKSKERAEQEKKTQPTRAKGTAEDSVEPLEHLGDI